MRAAPQYNFQEAKRTLTTAFNLERWSYYLKDYNDVIVTAFLQYGWPINHSADQLPRSTLHIIPLLVRIPHYFMITSPKSSNTKR